MGSGEITSDLPGREISIRSGDEGTSLIVEAPKDTVHHYNFLESLDVQAIHHRSYHEHGRVRGNVKLKQGEFVAEPNSEVETVIITSASAEGVSIVNNSGHTIEAAATNQEVLDALGTIVSGGTSSSLYGKLVDEEVLSNFAGGLGTTESPFLIANERQWETLVTTASFFEKNYNWSVISDLDFTGLEGTFGGKAFYGNIDFSSSTPNWCCDF